MQNTVSVCATHNQPVDDEKNTKKKTEKNKREKDTQNVELRTNDDDGGDDDDEMNSLTYSKCRRPTRSTHHFQSWLFYCNFFLWLFFLLSLFSIHFFFVILLILLLIFNASLYNIRICNKVSLLARVSHTTNNNNNKTRRCNKIFNCVGVWNVSVLACCLFAMIIFSSFAAAADYYYCLPTQQTHQNTIITLIAWHCVHCTVNETTNQKVCRLAVQFGATNYSYCQTTSKSIWSNKQCRFLFSIFLNFILHVILRFVQRKNNRKCILAGIWRS